ncbi:hypothetical protein BofuT4_uP117720.1 [Botrytis cinerea T4]|uniref:Uncharacterized protein n=1 Tax=Botryotinia fuckeliana (strain T4) TaxID=999810 RepID=G2Y0Q7_BOTF4|nr:hypothetical protein BofuT4_uP117720.1 [Botrytis cinerea T4]
MSYRHSHPQQIDCGSCPLVWGSTPPRNTLKSFFLSCPVLSVWIFLVPFILSQSGTGCR